MNAKESALKRYRKANSWCRRYPKELYFVPKDLQKEGKKARRFKLRLQEAEEPTNIHWENLEIGKCERKCRKTIVIFIVFILMVLSFAAIYLIRIYQNSLPDTTQCEIFSNTTLNNVSGKTDQELDCFCGQESLFVILQDNQLRSTCNEYLLRYSRKQSLNFGVSFSVFFVNLILKKFLLKLAAFERYPTVTAEAVSRYVKLFVALFVNLGILIIIVNINLQHINLVD
jgi:uncharacterized protein YpmB